MKEQKQGLGYQGCAECNVKVPEEECVSCLVPRRESLPLRSSLKSEEIIFGPIILGWGSAD